MDAHATYVGATRHRHTFNFFWSREEFSDRRDLVMTLSRERQKDVSLDYLGQNESPLMNVQYSDARHLSSSLQSVRNASKTLDHNEHYQQAKARLDQFVAARNDISTFKVNFESQHPELAKQIADKWQSAHEKNVAMHDHQGLEDALTQPGISTGDPQKELRNVAKGLTKDPASMAYADTFDENAWDRLIERAARGMFKHEKSREIDHDIDIGGR